MPKIKWWQMQLRTSKVWPRQSNKKHLIPFLAYRLTVHVQKRPSSMVTRLIQSTPPRMPYWPKNRPPNKHHNQQVSLVKLLSLKQLVVPSKNSTAVTPMRWRLRPQMRPRLRTIAKSQNNAQPNAKPDWMNAQPRKKKLKPLLTVRQTLQTLVTSMVMPNWQPWHKSVMPLPQNKRPHVVPPMTKSQQTPRKPRSQPLKKWAAKKSAMRKTKL